ncbi:MAG: type IV pilus secretin PilQ [Proteobacteria bacterium]|nr:type IV pilus secretin PilQ [Burkholderiales bacterium]
MNRSIPQYAADQGSARSRSLPWMLFCTLLAVAGSVLAQPTVQPMVAGNAIQSVSAAVAQGGNVLVRITLKEAPKAVPNGFQITNPSRLSFDFPNTSNGTGRTMQDVAQGDLRSLNLVQVGERTRLVLNMTRTVPYDARIEGNTIVVSLQGAGGIAAGVAPAPTRFAEDTGSGVQHKVLNIDFRRTAEGAGNVIIDLGDNNTGIDVKPQGRNIVIELQRTQMPQHLQRKLDVTDFATPVQFITAQQSGDMVRLEVTPRGQWEQSAYQADNRFILEVKPVVEDPTRLGGGQRRYTGDKLSLNFQNVEVRAVLQVLADFTGLNIITSDTVSGNLTLRLKDVPWDQAMDIILQAKGLDMRKTGNVMWIAPRDELATRDKLEAESRQQLADLEQVRTETFQLNYARADAFQKILTDPQQRVLSRRGSAVIDPRTNTLFIQDTPTKLDEMRRLVRQIDVPVRQVMIEARVVEAADTFSRNLGARLGVFDRQVGDSIAGSSRLTIGGNLEATGFLTSQIATPIPTLTQALGVNLPAQTIGGARPGAFSLIVFNDSLTRFLNLEVQALQAEGRGRIVSSPRVITADQIEATIEQGTEIPFQQATASGATAVSFKKATLSLKVRPQITPDGNVIMTLNVNNDSVGQNTQSGPAINTRQISTQVLVENGGTVVIGGIYTQDSRQTVNKVPMLGDLPFVGFLFRDRSIVDDKRELLIFVTPRVLNDRLSSL